MNEEVGVKYVKRVPIRLKGNPNLSEKWLQERILEDPSLLGFGPLNVRASEKTLPKGGRLDLLLSDSETGTRYEVELQLGATDESHIIRAIEYWDLERRRYPQYDHVAVIVAEEITARFFNVIGLFNGFIPIVAIQVAALEVGDDEVTLVFTRILDHQTLADEEEDDIVAADRSYWETNASPETMKLVDDCLALVQSVDPGVTLNFTKRYIGLARNGTACNYVVFYPKPKQINLVIKLQRGDEADRLLEQSSLVVNAYRVRRGAYRPVATHSTFEENREIFRRLFEMAHEQYYD